MGDHQATPLPEGFGYDILIDRRVGAFQCGLQLAQDVGKGRISAGGTARI
jgi:hypothetical protein